jgi:FtsP/CotA-like multicopper oxidase with cupredoxin domain
MTLEASTSEDTSGDGGQRSRSSLTRRSAIALLLASTAIPLRPNAANAQARPLSIPEALDAPSLDKVPFSEPPVIRSGGGYLSAALEVQFREETIDGKPALYRTYNGLFTGPTLRFRPGDTLDVQLVNQLPPEPDPGAHAHDPNVPHGFNTTNLHTHGLWVSPKSPADDVLLSLEPGGSFGHHYEIEPDHVSGTFWYHPHRHGSVERQVSQGMSGALIIEGGIDELPGISEATERLMVLQQIQPDPEPEAAAAILTVEDIAGPPNKTTTINGLHGPTLKFAENGLERWRLIAANYHDFMHIEIRHADTEEPIAFFPVAYDGIPVRSVSGRTRISLAPGNRADILVQPEEPGNYVIYKVGDGGQFDTDPEDEVIGYVKVASVPDQPVEFPREFPAEYSHDGIDEQEVTRKRRVVFSIDRTDGTRFLVDGKQFDPDWVDHVMRLGGVEEWLIENTSSAMHPFHIHVNPFQVVDISDGSIEPGRWLDTVPIPPGTIGEPGYVIMRTRVQKFTGTFVQHCHILAHEDRGMMQLIRIE